MTYGLSPRLFVENGPAVQAANAQPRRSSVAYRAWKLLDDEHRLAAVDKALKAPANDLFDAFPIAL